MRPHEVPVCPRPAAAGLQCQLRPVRLLGPHCSTGFLPHQDSSRRQGASETVHLGTPIPTVHPPADLLHSSASTSLQLGWRSFGNSNTLSHCSGLPPIVDPQFG